MNTPPQIVEAAVLQPKSGDGYYVALTWKIAEGEYEGRQVWQRITFLHSLRAGADHRPQDAQGSVHRARHRPSMSRTSTCFCSSRRRSRSASRGQGWLYDDKNKVKRILPLDAPPARRHRPAEAGRTANRPGTRRRTPAASRSRRPLGLADGTLAPGVSLGVRASTIPASSARRA